MSCFAGEFLLFRPTFITPYLSAGPAKTQAQLQAGPGLKIAQLETGRRAGRCADESQVVGDRKRG
jgi:hypothetical protein